MTIDYGLADSLYLTMHFRVISTTYFQLHLMLIHYGSLKITCKASVSIKHARIVRVVKAREGIYQQLLTRLKLIDKYAKVASMIEIEVEMDVDVLAAEAVGAVEEQVAHLIEAEDLQKKWRTQAEASDEVERLLNTAPLSNSS
ncbi:hypothetical protein O6H91_Y304500 [Diphasiastrum complanatum]|nr:hypothetical protein O6H91_Y304500 [Diphasiastrum complanatum]